MTNLQFIVVILLASLITGGGGYLAYETLHPYRYLAQNKKTVHVAYVSPIVSEIENARQLRAEGRLAEAQRLLRSQLRLHGRRPEAKAARELLGEINTEMFFSTDVPFGKTEYVVRRGDSLWRIARKLGSSPRIIMRINNMESDLIRPGERLFVPDGEFTLTLDLPSERAVIHHGDGFFKQYPIVSINLPHPIRTPITTKIKASTFWKDGMELSDASPTEQAASTPWLHLAFGGFILYGVSDEDGLSESAVEISDRGTDVSRRPDIPPRGIALLKEDFEEIQLLIDRGTTVTLVGTKL